jgi:hypothetical protein
MTMRSPRPSGSGTGTRPRQRAVQLNIRSEYARARVAELARDTGRSATEIVEDALRNYVPEEFPKPVGRLVRKGRLLVLPMRPGEKKLTRAEVSNSIEATRYRDPE